MVHAISLFSGAGGLDLGATRAGANVIACLENDSDSVKTLRANTKYFSAEVLETDITEFDFSQLREYIPKTKGGPLIVIGGPPCQPFSKNGYWVKNSNRKIDRDPRNLISQYLDCVQHLAPNGFILENVESLIHPTNRHVLTYIEERAASLGYSTQVLRLNAADYGVPQKRKRVFVLGFRDNQAPNFIPTPTHSDGATTSLFEDLPPHPGVKEFISPFSGSKFREPQESVEGGRYEFELKHVPMGKNYIHLSKMNGYGGRSFKPGSRFWNFLLKLHPEQPSWTIAAQPGPWVGPFHWDNRRLRVPEIAALQTFPRDYTFCGTRRSVQRQIGNAVPVKLAEKVVAHLLKNM